MTGSRLKSGQLELRVPRRGVRVRVKHSADTTRHIFKDCMSGLRAPLHHTGECLICSAKPKDPKVCYASGRCLLVHDHDGIDGPGVPFQSEGAVKEFFLSSKRCCNRKALVLPMPATR